MHPLLAGGGEPGSARVRECRFSAPFELKITAAGAEHRFLAGYNGVRTPEGKPYLVVVKYLKKKEWKLSRTAIDTAAARLARME